MKIQKSREMLRSILPSRASKTARFEKQIANRNNRRNVKVALSEFADTVNYDDEEEGDSFMYTLHESDAKKKFEIRSMKRERRGADKINHFVRWAKDKTKHIETLEDKYYSFVSSVGGTGDVIREHAIGHFIPKYLLKDTTRYYNYYYDAYFANKNRPETPKNLLVKKLEEEIRNGNEEEKLNKILGSRINFAKHICSKAKPCWKSTIETSVWIHCDILPDGTRQRAFRIHNGPFALKIIKQNPSNIQFTVRQYESWSHDIDICKRHVHFDGEVSVRRVVKILSARKHFKKLRELWEFVNG